jgi:RsiW-degrading membrane proteinase PrsW (M82 family)
VTPLAAVAGAAGLLVSTALLVVVVIFLWWLDRYDREPLLLVGSAFAWGAVAAAALSVSALGAAAAALNQPLGTLAGAALEELLKAVAVVLIARYSAEFDSPTDGLVYGTAAGLGFASVENLLLVAAAPAALQSPMLLIVFQRTLLSAGVHGLASGVVGAFIGLAHLSRGTLARVAWTAGGLAIGIALHGGWNAGLSFLTASPERWAALAALPVLYACYLGAFWLLLRWEHEVLRDQLEQEAGLKLVPSWVPEVTPFYRRRIRADWWPRRSERVVLSRLLTRLAFRRYQTSRLPEGEAALASLEVVRLRGRVRRMLEPEAAGPDDDNVNPV